MFGDTKQQLTSLNRSARLFLIAMIIDGIACSAWRLFYNIYILERVLIKNFWG
jgi:hypothetical protein